MKTKTLLLATFAATIVAFTSCNHSFNKSNSTTSEQTTTTILEVDSLLSYAAELTNQPIVVEGLCTHTCQHGGTKLFLMGSNDTQTIRVEAGKLGSFDNKCVNNIVRIYGTLIEERIDESYLQQWEAKIQETMMKQHGESEAGCSTEKQARGEKANTVQERIADFRTKIAQRQASENKPYLSFYYIEADNYEIK